MMTSQLHLPDSPEGNRVCRACRSTLVRVPESLPCLAPLMFSQLEGCSDLLYFFELSLAGSAVLLAESVPAAAVFLSSAALLNFFKRKTSTQGSSRAALKTLPTSST